MLRHLLQATFCVGLCVMEIVPTKAASFIAANLQTNDLGYSSVTGLVYASVPNASATNPNTLTPINPNSAVLGTPIPIGFDPGRIAASFDGNNIFTVIGGQRAVQRYNIPTATADQLFTISGGPQITDMYPILGRPNAVALHEAALGFSPPAITTAIYENALLLPDQVGHGLGVGGPDIFAVDPTDGTKAYGYQNTISSYDNVPMVIGPTGINGAGSSALQGVLTGAVGHIAILGDRLFDDQGQIFSLTLGFQIGSFTGAGDFLLDPNYHRFYSISTSGATQTIRAYSLTTLTLLGTDTVTGVSGSTSSLTRFGVDGLAFRTANQVVFVHSAMVPEPSSICLLICGIVGLGITALWRRLVNQGR